MEGFAVYSWDNCTGDISDCADSAEFFDDLDPGMAIRDGRGFYVVAGLLRFLYYGLGDRHSVLSYRQVKPSNPPLFLERPEG